MSIVGTRPPLISETNLYEPRHKVRAVRYDSDFIWESESWPAGEYIVSEKDRNAEKFPFSIAKDK